jgi:hypothetical protein
MHLFSRKMSLVTSRRLAYHIEPGTLGDPLALSRSLTRDLQSQWGIPPKHNMFLYSTKKFQK